MLEDACAHIFDAVWGADSATSLHKPGKGSSYVRARDRAGPRRWEGQSCTNSCVNLSVHRSRRRQ